MLNNTEKPFRSIKAKLIIAVVSVSFVLTSLIIFINLYSEYHKDLGFLDQKLQQIKESSVPSIVSVVWNLDIPYLTVQAESIVKIKDIVKVSIKDSRNLVMVEKFHLTDAADESLADTSDQRIYRYPLYHFNKRFNSNEFLGTVEIIATTKNIKTELYTRLKMLVFAEIIKSFLLSCLILIIINLYINKNLEQIIQFTKKFNPNSIANNFLKITRKNSRSDEIDILQEAINRMIEQINFLNTEKERKITEQEKKIEMQQIAAINSSKLAALGEMAGSIAHEINNPLTIILTNSKIMEKMIEKGIPNPELFLKSSHNIIKTVDRISTIVSGLKNISRDATNEKKQLVPFKVVLLDVFSLCEEKFKNNQIKIICDLSNPLFDTVLNCFQVQLSQVFLNLFNNSYDAIRDLDDKWIKIEVSKTTSFLVINFIDSGKGIPKIIADKIFQPFFTTKEIGRGTGIGLSLVYGIIKHHDGEIYYNDKIPNTCFTIKLPLV